MKKLKYAFWLILIAFIAVVIWQNWDYFTTPHVLKLNLFIYNEPIPPLTNGAIIAICVGIGVMFMMLFYFASRYENYRANKTIKALRLAMEESQKSISHLQQEVELLKGGSPVPPAESSESEEKVEGLVSENESTQETQS